MKLFTTLILIILLCACGGSGSELKPLKIELNGDSIMYGHGIDIKPDSRLKEFRPDLIIENKAESGLTLNSLVKGYTTAWANGPIPRLGVQPPFSEIKRTSDVVVISLGGNDAYGNLPISEFENQLRAVISIIQNEGRTPIITGIVQLTPSDTGFDQDTVHRSIEFNKVINNVTNELNVINANWSTVEYNGLSDTIDQIHRTQIASDRLVLRLAETIDKIK